MTVKKLKALLDKYPDNMEVFHSIWSDRLPEPVNNICKMTFYKKGLKWDEIAPIVEGVHYKQKQVIVLNLKEG